jgi:predicted DNA-binding transcriptional regulator AlpA
MEHLRVRDAARYVGLSVSTLNKLRGSGNGPVFMKLGRIVVYRREDLDDWLASKRVRSTSEAAA